MSDPTRPQPPGGNEPWYRQGSDPDYRFSLANERTFLAWIRTALAVLAVALVLHQVSALLGLERLTAWLCSALAVFAAMLGVTAYPRWKQVERAMRHNLALPYTRLMPTLAFVMTVIAAAAAAMMLVN